MTDLNKLRSEFETYEHSKKPCAIKEKLFEVFTKDGLDEDEYSYIGKYVDSFMQEKWELWQKAKAQAAPVWISSDFMKPDEGDLVLGISATKLAKFNVYQVVALDEFDECEINYWMPLPTAPSESGAEG